MFDHLNKPEFPERPFLNLIKKMKAAFLHTLFDYYFCVYLNVFCGVTHSDAPPRHCLFNYFPLQFSDLSDL